MLEPKMIRTALLPFLRNDKIPLRLRKKIGKIGGVPQPDIAFQVRLFDSVFEGKTGPHQDNKIYMYGSHEAATLRLMRTILERQRESGQKPVYLDIGTNIGQHLVAVAGLTDTSYGFEPWDRVRACALRNVAINNFSHVEILPFGLSDQDAYLPYFPPASGNLGNGSFLAEAEDTAEPITLEVRRGDDVVQNLGAIPSLIKIDTEGFESYVLKGLKSTLEASRPAVIFELGDLSRRDFTSLETIKGFFPAGYSIHGILRSREYPKVEAYRAGAKYENLLAWPDENFSL